MPFDVLNRQEKFSQSCILEASAGTGKTFAIEHMVVRLLLEQETIPLEQILAVTFTKAATRDLKRRIRSNIESALAFLNGEKPENSFDYLQAIVEQDAIKFAKRRLNDALLRFDQSQIFTIHGFCTRMLRENLFDGDTDDSNLEENNLLSTSLYRRIIRNFFRTELHEGFLRPIQLKILLRSRQDSLENLEKDLIKILKSGFPVASPMVIRFEQFQKSMQTLVLHRLIPEKIVEDFLKQAPAYEKMCDRSRKVKEEHLQKVEKFAALLIKKEWNLQDFDLLLQDGVFFVDALAPKNRKASSKFVSSEELNYPHLHALLKAELKPLVDQARHPNALIVQIAYGCQAMLHQFLQHDGFFSFDEVIRLMAEALNNVAFTDKIRSKYRVAIIDECQDIDPQQWKIFSRLFLSSGQHRLFLVGDPKQSIYGFRQADIYTYLTASEALGKCVSLDTNFRSAPSLVQALNILFSKEAVPDWLTLPRIGCSLPYTPVKAGIKEGKLFSDDRRSIHFCIAATEEKCGQEQMEENFLFPFFVDEILRLHQKDGVSLQEFAILVSDRYQAQRLSRALEKRKIPTKTQNKIRNHAILLIHALREIIQATLHPSGSDLKIALGGLFLKWTPEQLQALTDAEVIEPVIHHFQKFQRILIKSGFGHFLEALLRSPSSLLDITETVLQSLLKQKEGMALYEDLQQIADLVIQHESQTKAVPNVLLKYLDSLAVEEDSEIFKKRDGGGEEAVRILTMHASKGLEFGIVFALGLISKTRLEDEIIPVEMALQPVLDKDSESYRHYCAEVDAEKMRQLYVVMTRAKYRLYLPVTAVSSKKVPERGSASPMELFVARLGQPMLSDEQLYQKLETRIDHQLTQFLRNLPEDQSISYSMLTPQLDIKALVSSEMPSIETLVSPPTVHLFQTEGPINSFTSLAQVKDLLYEKAPAPQDYQNPVKSMHSLPSSKEVGVILHSLLETLPLDLVKGMHTHQELLPLLNLDQAELVSWEEIIAQMLFQVLKSPLGSRNFCLCDVSLQQSFREMEFLYAYGDPPSYMKGVIDWVFYYEDKYYIIDWKSNWLGPDQSFYSQQYLEQTMEQHDYFLQAKLYVSALERYLNLVDPRPFKEIFGGAFYIFLRGGSDGIYEIRNLLT